MTIRHRVLRLQHWTLRHSVEELDHFPRLQILPSVAVSKTAHRSWMVELGLSVLLPSRQHDWIVRWWLHRKS